MSRATQRLKHLFSYAQSGPSEPPSPSAICLNILLVRLHKRSKTAHMTRAKAFTTQPAVPELQADQGGSTCKTSSRPPHDPAAKEHKDHRAKRRQEFRRPFAFYACSCGHPTSEICNSAHGTKRSVCRPAPRTPIRRGWPLARRQKRECGDSTGVWTASGQSVQGLTHLKSAMHNLKSSEACRRHPRREVQLAADQAWPWRTAGMAALRKALLLPPNQPLKD